MGYEVRAGWMGEGKLPLPGLLQGHARRHAPAIVRDAYDGGRVVDAAGDERGRLHSDAPDGQTIRNAHGAGR